MLEFIKFTMMDHIKIAATLGLRVYRTDEY